MIQTSCLATEGPAMRTRSPAECFLLDAGFARWDDAPSLFTFPLLGCSVLAAVCDLCDSTESSFLLAVADASNATARAAQDGALQGTRVEANISSLLVAQHHLLNQTFGSLWKQIGSMR